MLRAFSIAAFPVFITGARSHFVVPITAIQCYIYVNSGGSAETTFAQAHLSKKGCKDQESIQSSTTPDPGYQWESDKLTVRHHKQKPRGQPFPSR